MKQIFFLLLVAVLVQCSSSKGEGHKANKEIMTDNPSMDGLSLLYSVSVEDIIKDHFIGWKEYYESLGVNVQFSDLDSLGERGFDNYSDKAQVDSIYLSDYAGLIFESPDSKKLLDIYGQKLSIIDSNGTRTALVDVDSEVFYFDKVEQTRNRILYGGSSVLFEEASWLSDYLLAIVGSNKVDENITELCIWLIDLNSRKLNKSCVSYMSKENTDNYLFNYKLDNLNIHLEESN